MNGLTNQSFQKGLNTSQKTGINKPRTINQGILQVKRDRSKTIISLDDLSDKQMERIRVTSEELSKERAKRANEKKMLDSNVDPFEGFESLAESSFKSHNNTPNFEQWQVLFKSNKVDLKSNEDGETTDESAPSSIESRAGKLRQRADSVDTDISNFTNELSSMSSFMTGKNSVIRKRSDSINSDISNMTNSEGCSINYSKVNNSFDNNLSNIREEES